MSLLAYSLRRAWGSLLVFLGVVWLIMLGMYHVAIPPFHPVERLPEAFYTWDARQPALAREWNVAALEVGIGVLLVLGIVGLWRLRPKMQPFWVLLATGSVLLAFGLASFGVALANQDYRRLHLQDPATCERACIPPAIERGIARQYNRGINPTPWWIAGSISTGLGVALIGTAYVGYRRRPNAAQRR